MVSGAKLFPKPCFLCRFWIYFEVQMNDIYWDIGYGMWEKGESRMTLKASDMSHWKGGLALFWNRRNSARRKFCQGRKELRVKFWTCWRWVASLTSKWGVDLTVGYRSLELRVEVRAVNKILKVITIYIVFKAVTLGTITKWECMLEILETALNWERASLQKIHKWTRPCDTILTSAVISLPLTRRTFYIMQLSLA